MRRPQSNNFFQDYWLGQVIESERICSGTVCRQRAQKSHFSLWKLTRRVNSVLNLIGGPLLWIYCLPYPFLLPRDVQLSPFPFPQAGWSWVCMLYQRISVLCRRQGARKKKVTVIKVGDRKARYLSVNVL